MVFYLEAPLLSPMQGVRHGFFTRQVGVVEKDFPLWKERNAQEVEKIWESRQSITSALGFKEENLVTARQVHSSHVLVVEQPFEGALPKADGLVTKTPGLLLGVLTADCVPVLLSTPRGDVVAAVHAGWRGSVAGVLEASLHAMRGLGAGDVIAALGPCIWQESYEVSQEFYDHLSHVPFLFKPGRRPRHWQFDLPGYVMHRLAAAGVKSISSSLADTFKDAERFFSFRRKTTLTETNFGNMISGIGIV